MKRPGIILMTFLWLVLIFSGCSFFPEKETPDLPDYDYIMVTVNIKVEATINTRPARSELISCNLLDPDTGGDIGPYIAENANSLGYFEKSAVIKMFKDRKIGCKSCLYWYEKSSDVIGGNVCDYEELDWETAATYAYTDNNGTTVYTWNVSEFLDIKLKKPAESQESIGVQVYATFKVNKWNSPTDITPASGQTVRAKIYHDWGATYDFTLETNSTGCTSEVHVSFILHENEIITTSAFLKDRPDIYNSESIGYSQAEAGAITEWGGNKVYNWRVILILNKKN